LFEDTLYTPWDCQTNQMSCHISILIIFNVKQFWQLDFKSPVQWKKLENRNKENKKWQIIWL
jgi:hypothetical protein